MRPRQLTTSAESGIMEGTTIRAKSLPAGCADLPLKPNQYVVADLPENLSSPTEAQGCWWVARVRHDQESTLVRFLGAVGMVWCMPQRQMVTRYPIHRKVYRRFVPLFRDYVPFCAVAGEELSVLDLKSVCDLLRVVEQDRFVRQLDAVYRVNQTNPLDPFPFATEGKEVVIIRGRFLGTRGIVDKRDGITRLVLRVDLLGDSVAMEVDIADLGPVPE